ncbi:hypothetical protein MKW98_009767 [Papaver atlanticum]|uniref:Uncharacterized protein n=1 Tax=Papaver atlanticum TaxID=357466 RepID=A0AAD4SX49_9MAGN|nr:hypothetical protein MKW98_009767 [Papaver atlanticum]
MKEILIISWQLNFGHQSIPYEIGGAVALRELKLEKNSLSGKISCHIEKCSSLTTLTNLKVLFLQPWLTSQTSRL